MRLLFLSSEFPPGPGGIGTHAHQLAFHLLKLGWEVTVISPQDYSSDEEIGNFNNQQPFPILRLRPISHAPIEALYRWRKASHCIKEWNPDLLVASGTRFVWLTACLSRLHGKPWVAIGHGTEFGLKKIWERLLTRWSFQQANAVICVSNFTWKRMLSSGINPQSGCVIPNGADSNRFRILPESEVSDFRASLNLPDSSLLLTVGNVTPRKGQDLVIRAMPHILKELPDVHYLIVGIPTNRDEFLELARKLGVANHVHFIGKADSDSVVRFLNSCDVFLMTSKHTIEGDFEGYGIAVVEAALCGKPAIVTSNSGLVEAIIDKQTGFVVPESDEFAIAQRVIQLLSDDNLRRRMGESARSNSYNIQTWLHRAKEYHLVFQAMLGSQPLSPQEKPLQDTGAIPVSDDFKRVL